MKTINSLLLAVSLLIISLSSCKSQAVAKNKTVEPAKKPAPAAQQSVSPNHARVTATVIYINPVLMPGDSTDPCHKAPCKTRLRIESVLGIGQAFGNPKAPGDSIYATFMFTTHAATKDLFPVLNDRYPGVKVGDVIQTDLESRMGMGGGGSISYFVYGYKVLGK